MPFTNDSALFQDLLDRLRDNRDSWVSARTFADCQEAVSGISGVEAETLGALVEQLRDFFVGNEELMLQQLRLTALAWTASDFGLTGAQWQGYFIAELADGEQLYASDRFAEPSQWAKVEVDAETLALAFDQETGLLFDEDNWYLPDGQTVVTLDAADPTTSRDEAGNTYVRGKLTEGAPTVADLREQHFDGEVQRWRRWSDDGGEFEHYNDDDGVWERLRGQDGGRPVWYRRHGALHGWLRYDADSDTWLDPGVNQWRPHVQVGSPLTPVTEPVREEAPATDGDLRIEDLQPELREFLEKLYELDPEHRNVPIRTVLEVLVEVDERG